MDPGVGNLDVWPHDRKQVKEGSTACVTLHKDPMPSSRKSAACEDKGMDRGSLAQSISLMAATKGANERREKKVHMLNVVRLVGLIDGVSHSSLTESSPSTLRDLEDICHP